MFKRILCCALALLLLGGAATGEALVCVRAPGVAALVDERGVERVENGRYDDIFVVREGGLYAAGGRGAGAPFGFFLGQLLICMLSPKSGEIRYLLMVLYALPAMLGALLLEMKGGGARA